jgi:hypothetical protein
MKTTFQVKVGNLSLMEKWHGVDVEDEVISATTACKEEVRCRYGRGGTQVAISQSLGKWRLQRMKSEGMEWQGMLDNYLLTILTGYGGGRVARLMIDEHLWTRPMFLHEV